LGVPRKIVDLTRLKKKRVQTIRTVMAKSGVDAVILTNVDNIRYLTDVRCLLHVDGQAAVMVRDRDPEVIAPFVEGAPLGYAEVMPPQSIPREVVSKRWATIFRRFLGDLSSGTVGVDSLSLCLHQAAEEELPNLKFKSVCDDLMRARAIKHDEEIELLEEAASITDLGAETAYQTVKEGKTEHRIVAEIVSTMAEAGIEALPWYPNLRSGERSLQTIFPSDRKVRKGDSVVFDIGCVGRGGYWGDMSRTVFVDEPRDELEEAYAALFEAYMETVKAIRPGMMASEIHVSIKSKLREAGYPYMTAPTGHGLGVGMDYPWITDEAAEKDMRLETNMVLSVEPVTYTKTGSVKVEDAILVTDTGSEILNKARYY